MKWKMIKLQKSTSPKQASSSGSFIPLVTSVLVVLTIGGATLITRGFGGLIGSVRQQNSRAAREAAESGLAITLEGLNDRYSYQLLNCYDRTGGTESPVLNADGTPELDEDDEPKKITTYLWDEVENSCLSKNAEGKLTTGTWESPKYPSAVCGSLVGYPEEIDLNDSKSRYRIDYYAINGTKSFGGTGSLKVTGEVLDGTGDNAKVVASSTIVQEFNITPRACPSGSGFPGLLALNQMDLGNNDVRGFTSGNVFCIGCTVDDPENDNGTFTQDELENAVQAGPKSDVDGQIYIGNLDVPPVKTFPSNLEATETSISSATTITAGDSNDGMCATDADQVTHCKISSIELKGKSILTIDSTAGPIILYISGDVKAGGSTGILHTWTDPNYDPMDINSIPADPPAARLSLFGNPRQGDLAEAKCRDNPDYFNQSVTLAGSSKPAKAANLFAYFPCAETGINGAGGEAPDCDETPEPECGGGDISGAVWTKDWGLSNSNVATLTVPANMAEQLKEFFGDDYDVRILGYSAQGIKDWRGFQGLSQ